MTSTSLLKTSEPLSRSDNPSPNSGQQTWPQGDFLRSPPGAVALPKRIPLVPSAELRAFRNIGSDYLSEKTYAGYAFDMFVYALVAGVSAWALVATLSLIVELS